MLERCPYYELCDSNTRQIRGNSEYYCMGSLNWEFCHQFKDKSLSGEIPGFGRDNEIIHVARTIFRSISAELQIPFKILLISNNGEILYRDRDWKETYLLVAQNLIRYMIDSIEVGEYITLISSNNFLLFKILDSITLVCLTRTSLEGLINHLEEKYTDYQALLEEYISNHPISTSAKEKTSSDEGRILQMLSNLQAKLQAINPEMIIKDLHEIQDKILNYFSWNRIFYEIASIIEKLEKFPSQDELNNDEKEEILGKIREWQEQVKFFS